MKKSLSVLLALLMFFLAACGAIEPTVTTDTIGSTAPTTVVTTEALADQGIKNIILIIGDGMGNAQLEAGQLVAAKKFGFTDWAHTLVNTNSLDSKGEPTETTDSAASATALATGVLTRNGRIGQDSDKTPLKTILDYASQDYGKATGIITTDALSGATPSAFSAHASNRNSTEEILASQLTSNVNLLCGKFSALTSDYRSNLRTNGYTYCDTIQEARESVSAEKAYWLLGLSDHTATDKLATVTTHALDFLSKDPDGFVLMIEQANIDHHGHSNTFDGLPQCVNILNDTVEAVLQWVGDRDDTAIIITADHETGGLKLSREPSNMLSYRCADGSMLYYDFTTDKHTPTEVSCYVYGFDPHFERFYTEQSPSTIKNKNIFDMMLDLLQNPKQES